MIRFLMAVGLGAAAVSGVEAQPRHSEAAVGYLGIGSVDINAELAKELKLPEEVGVEVTKLEPGSPAAVAGLRLNDVIVQFNGQRVEGQNQFVRLLSETPPGREVRIQIYRNGYAQSLIAKIGVKPPEVQQVRLAPFGFYAGGAGPDIPTPRMSWRNGMGAEWETVDGQLAAWFGVKDSGVLVRSVASGSVAERAGLKAGDVIVRVGDTRVATPADVSGLIRAGRAPAAMVIIVRERREMSLTIPLGGGEIGK